MNQADDNAAIRQMRRALVRLMQWCFAVGDDHESPVINWQRGTISTDGKTWVLRPQSLAVLRLLHGNAGQIVSKEQFMAAIWPDVAVTDDSLVQCISDIRKALGDVDHTIVKTLSKRGYLLEPGLALDIMPAAGRRQRSWWLRQVAATN